MNPEQAAALERLIASSGASPALAILGLLRGITEEDHATAARRMAANGLTIEEAGAFLKARHDAHAQNLISQLVEKVPRDGGDDRIVLDWTVEEAHRAATRPDAGAAGPAVFRQLFGVGCQYHWSQLEAADFCAHAKAIWANTVHCELMELVARGDRSKHQAGQIEKLKPWAEACRASGLILMISTNSDGVLNAGATADPFIRRLEAIQTVLGPEGILLQPVSEFGNEPAPLSGHAARLDLATRWPVAQLAGYGGVPKGAAYAEVHPYDPGYRAHKWNTLVVTNSARTLADRLGPDEMVRFAQRNLDAGASFVVYGFQRQPDWKNWERIRPQGAILPPGKL